MLIFCRFHSIGILVFMFHTTCSFVLLTANMEDVKRIASKLVPQALAEKIVDFIAKASQHMTPNASDEMSDQVSEENNEYNRARQKKEFGTQNINDNLSKASDESKERAFVEEQRVKIIENTERVKVISAKYTDRPINDGQYVISKENNPRFDPSKDIENEQPSYTRPSGVNSAKANNFNVDLNTQPGRQYYAIESNGQVNSKYMQGTYKTKPKFSNQMKVASTIGYAEEYYAVGNDKRAVKKLKSRINHSRTHKVTTENQLEVTDADGPSTNLTDRIQRAIKDLTTKRARDEFDQYDNINYPKPDFIATSGPVALPKIPSDKIWMGDNDPGRRKSWF